MFRHKKSMNSPLIRRCECVHLALVLFSIRITFVYIIRTHFIQFDLRALHASFCVISIQYILFNYYFVFHRPYRNETEAVRRLIPLCDAPESFKVNMQCLLQYILIMFNKPIHVSIIQQTTYSHITRISFMLQVQITLKRNFCLIPGLYSDLLDVLITIIYYYLGYYLSS